MKLDRLIKKDMLIAGISILLVMIALGISSYALFFRVEETNEEVINYGDLKVDFTNNTETINRTLDYPRTDAEGAGTEAFSFTITNTGTLDATYTVNLTDDTNYITQNALTKISDEYIKYSINSGTPALLNTITNGELVKGTLAPGAKVTYTLKFWLKSDAPNAAIGTSLVKKVNVKAEYIPES